MKRRTFLIKTGFGALSLPFLSLIKKTEPTVSDNSIDPKDFTGLNPAGRIKFKRRSHFFNPIIDDIPWRKV